MFTSFWRWIKVLFEKNIFKTTFASFFMIKIGWKCFEIYIYVKQLYTAATMPFSFLMITEGKYRICGIHENFFQISIHYGTKIRIVNSFIFFMISCIPKYIYFMHSLWYSLADLVLINSIHKKNTHIFCWLTPENTEFNNYSSNSTGIVFKASQYYFFNHFHLMQRSIATKTQGLVGVEELETKTSIVNEKRKE